ncbi:MAG: VWA domain-containing protein [Acidobacteriota bacterium]|nr:VWA domain-containing protein [Acidobacteriota bacterium]
MLTHTHTFSPLKSLLLATLLCLAAAAQNPQPQQAKPASSKDQDTLRIETELVQIDLIVADKQGKPVHDLKREDFELYEDGKKQTLTHFAVGTAKQPAQWLSAEKKRPTNSPSGEPATTTESAGRHIVLAVDDYHLSPGNLGYVKRALTKFITEQMVGGDQIAVVTTSGNVGLFQQFTGERDVLMRAINRLTVQEKNIVDSNSIPRITEHQAELIEFGDREALELAISDLMRREGSFAAQTGQTGAQARQGNQSRQSGQASQNQAAQTAAALREMTEGRVKSQARMILSMSGNYTQATLNTLENVIRNLRSLAGRKMMILLSDGFFIGGNSIHSKLYDIRRLTDAATRAGVVIYSIDARGLVAVNLSGDASSQTEIDPTLIGAQSRIEMSAIAAKRDGLGLLAEETGGSLFFNSNDLNLGLQRVLDANEVYYVLAYEPLESRRDGRFHKIEVRIANRPELKVRTRNGYFSPDDKLAKAEKKTEEKRQEKLKSLPPEKLTQELKAEKDKQMIAGIGSLFPLKDIPVEMAVDFIDLTDGSGAIINTHIEAANLSFEEVKGRQQSVVEMTGMLFDERGKVATSFSERININVKPENLDRIVRHGFNYRTLTALKPGFYQTRLAVREEKTGRLGSANGWVEIPDVKNKQLMLSGILLSDAGNEALQNVTNTANQNEGYAPRPSSASRRFKSGGDVDFLFFTYNAKIEKNTVDLVSQTQLFSGSKLVYASPIVKMAVPAESNLQRVPYAARTSLKGFAPGQYELRLMVIDRLTKATAYRRVNFTVE